MTINVYVVNGAGVKMNEIKIESSLTKFQNMLLRDLPLTDDRGYNYGRTILINSFDPDAVLFLVSYSQAKYVCKLLRYCVMEYGLRLTCTSEFLSLLEIFHNAIESTDLTLYVRSDASALRF